MQAVVTNSVHVDVHVSPEQLRSIAKCIEDEFARFESSRNGQILNADAHHFGSTLRDGAVSITFHPPKHLNGMIA